MAMHMKLQMKMTQQLIMTPQLQQAIKLLQLSRAELEELIEQSLVENPVLEESMDIDTYPSEEQREMTTEQTEVPVSEETYETAREEEKEETTAQEEVDWQQYVEQVDQYGQYQDRRIRSGGDDDADGWIRNQRKFGSLWNYRRHVPKTFPHAFLDTGRFDCLGPLRGADSRPRFGLGLHESRFAVAWSYRVDASGHFGG